MVRDEGRWEGERGAARDPMPRNRCAETSLEELESSGGREGGKEGGKRERERSKE